MPYKLLFNATIGQERIVALRSPQLLSSLAVGASCRIEVDFDLNAVGVGHTLLFNVSDYSYLRIMPSGIIRAGYLIQSGFNDEVQSSAQSLVVGQKYTLSFDLSETRKVAELRLNSTLIGSVANRWGTFRVKDVGLWPGSSALNGHIYEIRQYQNGVLTGRQSAENVSSGNVLPDVVGSNNMSQSGTWPANDSEWVPYGNVSVQQDVVVPASKQQDTAAAVTVGTTQVLTAPATKQQDTAAVFTIGTTQVLTVPAAKQQDVATAVTIGTNQVLSVPATKQQDVAAAVSVAQVAPGSQPITVPAAKQQDVAGVVTVGTSQLITAAGTKQQDSASAISIGQSQIVSVAAIKQQDKAAPITIGTIQTLAVQPVTQADTAARVAVGTTQLVAVPSAQQIDRAAAITLTQQPPITQTIDVRTLRIELTTPRFGVARNTPVYTAQLTTPRYTVARA